MDVSKQHLVRRQGHHPIWGRRDRGSLTDPSLQTSDMQNKTCHQNSRSVAPEEWLLCCKTLWRTRTETCLLRE